VLSSVQASNVEILFLKADLIM